MPGLECLECGLAFRRREHLNRHADRHRGVRPFTCNICGRSFSRRDTLKRHVSTHGRDAMSESGLDRAATARPAACQACARSKQRCQGRREGNTSCDACRRKGRECIYERTRGDGSPNASLSLSPALGRNRETATEPIESIAMHAPAGQQLPAVQELTSETAPSSNAMDLELPSRLSPTVAAWDAFFLEPNDLTFSLFPSPAQNLPPEFGDASIFAGTVHPSNTVEDEDALMSEHVPHVASVPAETHEKVALFVLEHITEYVDYLPSRAHLDVYVQLYFEYFHPRMPFLHVPTFDTGPGSWYLVVCAAALGCQYSTSSQTSMHLIVFRELVKHMVQRDVRPTSDRAAFVTASYSLSGYR